jgi:Protein of unknown function (DUF2924)
MNIPERIAALQNMTVPDLVVEYRAAFGKDPRVKNRQWLWRRVAWKIQEIAFGGLSNVAKRRIDELIAEMDLPFGMDTATAQVRPGASKPGTSLTRVWHGREIVVRVLDRGFEWDGVTYRSLTAVAKAVTGTHWNGRLFFGLAERKGA